MLKFTEINPFWDDEVERILAEIRPKYAQIFENGRISRSEIRYLGIGRISKSEICYLGVGRIEVRGSEKLLSMGP